ncbi:MAG: type IV secretion system protein DotC [Legionellaceae bacterium]|nr:type IV secretion system protein DotC [Legionellaceae bacterium]HAF87665.1 type IV secretion system protein DotC [Legionellales bacterium]HCA89289.1 type IV secretion system protein DotC [Legionellales bacterium]|tara:strand:+ start:571 stop:1497 length:927 start_codon:yes stop_codon:yes gene_type:complete
MQKFIRSFLLASMAFCLGCTSSHAPYVGNTDSLAGLRAMANSKVARGKNTAHKGHIRLMAIKETALSVGAQSGLAYQANLIDKALYHQARTLDTVYDFNALILQHNILPPVLLEGRNTLNLANDQTIRTSNRVYKIHKQAKFITTAPNWRQYLWLDYKKPEYPNKTLLPKNRAERQIWCSFVEKGWKNGIEQANIILEESIARIKQDYVGMLLYRKLLAMNMVTAPFVSHTDLGVTGDESEIHIDDRVLRIAAMPGLNVHSREWNAAVARDDDALLSLKNREKIVQNNKIVITSKAWQPVIAPVNDEP